MLRRCIYNLPMLFIFIVLCAAVFLLDGKSAETRLWNNYYPVAVPEGTAEKILEDGIFKEETVSFYNSSVNFNDYGKEETIPLSRIGERFIPGDPRLDPYMLESSEYFFTVDGNGNRYELVYVKSGRSAWDFYFHTRHIAGKRSETWIFPDFRGMSRIYSILLFAVSWFFGIWLLKGLRLIALFSGVPWMAAVVVNGAAFLPVSVSLLLFFLLLVRELFPDMLYHMNYGVFRLGRNTRMYAAVYLFALISGCIVGGTRGVPVLPVFMAVVADVICILVYFSLKGQRVRMQEHRIFFPVSLTSAGKTGPGAVPVSGLVAAVAAIILLPMFMQFVREPVNITLPVPQKTAEHFSDWSWESLEYIDKTGEGLVNAADLVSHQAYQDGFMYGRKWGFPQPDEKIIVDNYVAVNNKIELSQNCVRQFTDEWYISIIKPELRAGLAALLLSQSSPGGVILKSDISETVSSFNPVEHLILSLLAIMPVLWQFISKVNITLRRKGQEA